MFPNSRAHRPPTIAGSNSGKSAPGPGAGARTPAPVIVLECVLSWFALLSVAWPVAAGVPTRLDCMFEYCHPGRDHLDLGDDMLTALASGAGNPAVAGVLGLGAAGLAGVVVAMAWSVHARQIRVAEQLARRQFMVTTDADMTGSANGNGHRAEEARGANGAGAAVPVIIEGPDTVVTGEQARYRVRRSGDRKVVSWAAGGGSVAQSPDPAHPEELLLIADQPGDLMVSVRVREGIAERRGIKSVTAVPDMTPPPAPSTPWAASAPPTSSRWSPRWPPCSASWPSRAALATPPAALARGRPDPAGWSVRTRWRVLTYVGQEVNRAKRDARPRCGSRNGWRWPARTCRNARRAPGGSGRSG